MAGKRYEVRNTAKLEVVIIINLYSKTETNFNHNGLCILQPIEAVVTEELNGDYSLKLTMPRGSQLIENEQIIKVPTPKSSQPFRVYNFDVDMLGNPVFYCRHIFYDLLDYFIEDTRPSGSGALAILRILENTPFTGTSDITNQGSANYQMMSPVKAILGADNAFIEVWGGELERDNFNIKMKNHIGEDRGVSIRYRKNLTGLRFVTDLSGVATKIMPTGLKADGQTLLKLPEKYVESPLIGNYVNEKVTRIHYSDIKIDEKMSETEALNALRNAANQEFENGVDKPQVTATVEFVPLQDTEEYKDFSILETVYLGDSVSVHHEKLNIDLVTKVIGYEFDSLSCRYNKVTLGNANPKYGDIQRQYVDKVNSETRFAINSEIVDTEKKVTQEFKAADGELSSIITEEITRARGAEETLSSSITQNARNITLKVSKGDVSSQLSMENDQISISSNRISISSTYFTLSSSGKITCTSADISGTLETGGTYGYVKLSNGRLIGGNSSGESGYISFNHQVDGSPGPRIAGANGLVIATSKLGVADYLGPGASGTYYQGQSAPQTFVTNISDNGDGTISWTTKTITFTKGLMTTSL